jgi:hypothetical protein
MISAPPLAVVTARLIDKKHEVSYKYLTYHGFSFLSVILFANA